MHRRKLVSVFILFLVYAKLQNAQELLVKKTIIKGKVIEKSTGKQITQASVHLINTNISAITDKKGEFQIQPLFIKHCTFKISHIGYVTAIKELETELDDTINLTISLEPKINELLTFNVIAHPRPDTVYGSNNFSIIDFEFFEDTYILLTLNKKKDKPFLRLVDENKHIIYSLAIHEEPENIKELYRDFIGRIYLMCENSTQRIVIKTNEIQLIPVPFEDFSAIVKPVIDTLNGKLLFSNYNRDYPLFTYFSYNPKDSSKKKITTIENIDLMQAYRFEYYSLQPKDKLHARVIADEFGIDKHMAAALMSGFTQTMFYTPLYAPLYVISDTIHVFDHYRNYLFHFNNFGEKLDSQMINYHHPKNWKQWKNHMLKDRWNNEVYALYNNNGHQYLRQINYRNGKIYGKYKIIHHSANKIKIKEGYIYYTYRPFESLQEKFLYKEKILLANE